jgi:hypothetical protein
MEGVAGSLGFWHDAGMKIQTGDVFIWRAVSDTKYYFVGHDLVSMDKDLQGVHWCRIYFEDRATGALTGYKTILGTEYFEHFREVMPDAFVQIMDEAEKKALARRLETVKTPMRPR